MLKHNIFSNLVSGAWVPALGFAITPKQINLLGVEAFGLIIKWGIIGAADRIDITRIMQREEAIL